MENTKKLTLLGKGLYTDIPDEITIKPIPAASELDYVGRDDFDNLMLEKIFPQVIQEKFDYKKLLEVDYFYLLKELRVLTYGPYFTTSALLCYNCGKASRGRYKADLRTVTHKGFPEGFVNKIEIKADEFISLKESVTIKLPTIQQALNATKDKAFQYSDGKSNSAFARMCYMIQSIGTRPGMTPVEIKMFIEKHLTSADYMILSERITELSDYGLRAGGVTICPECGEESGTFIAAMDERMFRPTIDDLRNWKELLKAEKKGK